MERTADAAFVVSEEGEILSWNHAAEKLFGFTGEEALHKTCHQVLEGMGALGTHVCHENCSVLECTGGRDTEIPNFDLNVKTKSGQRIWINMSTIVHINERLGRKLLVHLAHDISEQKKAEEVLHKALEIAQQLNSISASVARPEPVSALSDQEKHVLRLFAEGKDSDEVAKALKISPQTLRNHLHHINQKLRTHNRLEAVMQALQRKLI